jgi:hypothetical protein
VLLALVYLFRPDHAERRKWSIAGPARTAGTHVPRTIGRRCLPGHECRFLYETSFKMGDYSGPHFVEDSLILWEQPAFSDLAVLEPI